MLKKPTYLNVKKLKIQELKPKHDQSDYCIEMYYIKVIKEEYRILSKSQTGKC